MNEEALNGTSSALHVISAPEHDYANAALLRPLLLHNSCYLPKIIDLHHPLAADDTLLEQI